MPLLIHDFQGNNQIITLGTIDSNIQKYRFKDSYTIKIHDCKAHKLDEDTGRFIFNMSDRDEALEAFCGEMLISIGIIDGELDPYLGNCKILCLKKGHVNVENVNPSGITKLTAFDPLRDSQSFNRLVGHSLVLSLNLSTFTVHNNELKVDFNIEKITIIGDLPLKTHPRPRPRPHQKVTVSIDALINKNYVHPIDPSCIRTKLLEIYTGNTSISSDMS